MSCPWCDRDPATVDVLPSEDPHWVGRRLGRAWALRGGDGELHVERDLLPSLPRTVEARRAGLAVDDLEAAYPYDWTWGGRVADLLADACDGVLAEVMGSDDDCYDEFVDYFDASDPDGLATRVSELLALAQEIADLPHPQAERLFT
jgi:hypothetical protein